MSVHIAFFEYCPFYIAFIFTAFIYIAFLYSQISVHIVCIEKIY